MHEISCIDETFDQNFTSEYKLSIQLGLDGFSFCIIDDIRKKYLVFKHFPFSLSNNEFLYREIKEIISNEEILNRQYKNTIISFVNQKFTAIPSGFEANENDIYKLNFSDGPDEIIDSFNTNSFDAKIIYSSSKKIREYLNSHFNEPSFIHQTKPLIKIAAHNTETEKATALISVSNNFFLLIVTIGEKLEFINSFSYSNNMDFIYFLLKTFDSIEINSKDSNIILTGEISEESHLVEFIKKYFAKVKFLKLAKGYQYSYTFSKFPPHMFTSVINPEG